MNDPKLQETIDSALKDIFEMMDAEVEKWPEGSFGRALSLQIATNNRNLLLQMDEFFKADNPQWSGADRLASQIARQSTMDGIDALKAMGAVRDLGAALS